VARSQGWKTILALLVGIAGATAFWWYGPFLREEVNRQVEEAVKEQAAKTTAAGDKAPLAFKAAVPGAGSRYQVVTDGKQTFLADLKEGRVWRYFHHTREGGHLKDEEGFLPLPFFYGGKKYPTAQVESGGAPGGAP
jgi:hypothetical protein